MLMFIPEGPPRVVIRERESESPIIGSDSSSSALFIGQTAAGPGFQVSGWDRDNPPRPVLVVSWDEYVRIFGRQLPGGRRQADVAGAYVSHAVRGFFDNGGKKAWILRLTTEVGAAWNIMSSNGTKKLFEVRAPGGVEPNRLRLAVQRESMQSIGVRVPAQASTKASNQGDPTKIELDDIRTLVVGDVIDVSGSDGTLRGTSTIIGVSGNVCTIHPRLVVAHDDIVRLAKQTKEAPGDPLASFRIPASGTKLVPGTLVELTEQSTPIKSVLWGVVERTDAAAVYITRVTADLDFYDANKPRALELQPRSFRVTISDSTPPPQPGLPLADLELENVSPVETSPRFLGRLLATAYADSKESLRVPLFVDVEDHEAPLHVLVPKDIPSPGSAPGTTGVNDAIGGLGAGNYQDAIDSLGDFEDAKLIVAPDTAVHPQGGAIQRALRDHCETRGDRFVLLDAPQGEHNREALVTRVEELRSDRGFAAFYYPWIQITAPREHRERVMLVPPSGHIAGMYARVDASDGVHKSPANEKLRGALDVERRLGDHSQGPLHDAGVNVLRVFHGDAAVNVFGGRTTAPTDKLDFRYIGVRRLFLFIEDALGRSLRGKIYEPNEPRLWKALTRNISEFLHRVQESGALFATDESPGFFVRINEGNNPPSQRAAGILNIEVGLRPSYPAEYIVVDIGVWGDGQVTMEER